MCGCAGHDHLREVGGSGCVQFLSDEVCWKERRGSQDLLPTVLPTLNRIVSFNRCQYLFFDRHAPLPKRVSLNCRVRRE
jgi:hypothetical protein